MAVFGGISNSLDLRCTFDRSSQTPVDSRTCHLDNVRILDDRTLLKIDASGRENNVTEVQLRGQINQISSEIFTKFPNLKTLEAWTVRLQTVKRRHFKGANKLETLNIGGNDISELGPRIFEHAPNLKRISLHENKIRYVDQETFYGLGNLTYLTLANNKIKMMQDETFKELKFLQTLDLNWNICVDKYFSGTKHVNLTQIKENLDVCDESYRREIKKPVRIRWRNQELNDEN